MSLKAFGGSARFANCSGTLLLSAVFMQVAGCGQKADVVFDIKLDGFSADGRPVIEIKPNGKPKPTGEGPFGDYYLVLRSSSEQPFTRQFDKKTGRQWCQTRLHGQ